MEKMFYWCNCILNWIKSLFIKPYKLKVVDEFLPEKLASTTLYIIQEDGFYEYASMVCPCGCGSILYMNLIPDERPVWKLIKHPNGTISLLPSIHRTKGCKSHFWLTNSSIHWCRNSVLITD